MAEARFKKAVYMIRNGPPRPNASNEEKLKFYGLYKQATEGDNTSGMFWTLIFKFHKIIKNFHFFSSTLVRSI